MQHPFEALRGEYASWLANATILPGRQHEVDAVANRILKLKPVYVDLEAKTGVPALWTMCTNERESGSNLHTYLGNGQSLNRVTTEVPRGRGPFSEPGAWVKGAVDAFHVDRITDVPQPWTPERGLFEWELWNGFGYRDAHRMRTPYVLGATSLAQRGKYTSDGHFDPAALDTQLGTLAMMIRLIELDPSLSFGTYSQPVPPVPDTTAPTPIQILRGTRWVQHALNMVDHAGLVEDGSFGRNTRRATRDFQVKFDVPPYDGWPGPITCAALDKQLAIMAGVTP